MSLRSFRYEDPMHREAAELLPWLVNCTLEGAERERVERHVSQCVACRRELEAARALQAAVTSEEDDPAVADALARLQVRLLEEETSPGVLGLWRALARRWRQAQPWARDALAAQFAMIVLLGGALAIGFLVARPEPAQYHTLGDPPPAASGRPDLAVVFKGERSEQEIRRLLLWLDARVVDGPSRAGVYTLEVPEGRQQAVLALLRGDPAVAFAGPVPVQGSLPK